MTCIAGLAHDGRVYIGGDSAGVAGLDLVVRADEKVFRNGEMLFGFTSSFRMGDLLRYSFTAPARTESQHDDRGYLATTWMDALRACLKAGGYMKIENVVETGGAFLLGYRGHLYSIATDFQVGEALDGFDAVGCGASFALGSLYSTAGNDPETRIQTGLRAAQRHSAGVREPFTILATER